MASTNNAVGSSSETNEHYCELCNLRVSGATSWQQHVESRGHRRKERFGDQFALNPEDMYLDDDAHTAKMLKDARGLIGLEHIVEDRTNDEIKCMLCRVLLKKDKANIIDHLRSYKHQFSYLENIDTNLIRSVQQKPLKKGELQHEVQKRCDELLKQFGRQKIRVYEEGYYLKRRQKLAEQRAQDNVNVEDLEELPKNNKVMQILLSSDLERFPGDETSYINNVMKDIPHPVIGLEYVAEYADPNNEYEPGYLCTLCESIMNSAQLVVHVLNNKHRLKYIERDHANYFKMISFSHFDEQKRLSLLQTYSLEIEKSRGRGLISLRLKLPPNCEFLFQYHKRINVRPQTHRSSSTAIVNNGGKTLLDAGVKVLTPAAAAFLHNEPDDYVIECGDGRYLGEKKVPPVPLVVPPATLTIPFASSSGGNIVSFVPKPPPQFAIPSLSAPHTSFAVPSAPAASAFEAPILPKKPNFIYSQKEADERRMLEMARFVPPNCSRRLESGWYSTRSKSWEFYVNANKGADYFSLRCPNARRHPYGDWSPNLMRRLQDQFNFELSHLAWLQGNLRHWRTPLYQPLEMVDLRPLEEEVESAVLRVLVGHTLKPVQKDRQCFEYDHQKNSTSSSSFSRPLSERQPREVIDYTNDPAGRRLTPELLTVESETQQTYQIQQQSSHPSLISLTISPGDSTNELKKPMVVDKSDQPPISGTERAILSLCEQILSTAKESRTKNIILQLLLSYKNADSVLYRLATKEPYTLQKIIAILKNPDNQVPNETLIELQSKFSAYSKL